tara:strand:+ start:537 stop:761 length:225 start_codon:yes stop_codon:yes gene_type:complete
LAGWGWFLGDIRIIIIIIITIRVPQKIKTHPRRGWAFRRRRLRSYRLAVENSRLSRHVCLDAELGRIRGNGRGV